MRHTVVEILQGPEVFRFDEDGLAEAYAKVTPEHESAAIEAKEECPVAVIMIEE